MRGDGKLSRSIRDARSWRSARFDAELEEAAGNQLAWKIAMSFSGGERNKLFLNRKARQFLDLSAISGLDSPADGRVLSLWDFDRDGWQDMVVVNSSSPLLNIYRNNIGAVSNPSDGSGRMIAIRFIGGNQTARASDRFSNRDGYGVKVRVTAGDLKLLREHRCGEGMAGQNSSTMFVGVGGNHVAQLIEVNWPSGVQQRIQHVAAGTLLTVCEDASTSPDQSGVTQEPYVVPSKRDWHRRGDLRFTSGPAEFPHEAIAGISSGDTVESRIRLYTTMATWCASCKRHLPQIRQLRTTLDVETLGLFGVPVDVGDDSASLIEYERDYQPAYTLLKEITDDQRSRIEEIIVTALKSDALPSSVVTDSEGKVLIVTPGVPTVSQIRQLLY